MIRLLIQLCVNYSYVPSYLATLHACMATFVLAIAIQLAYTV